MAGLASSTGLEEEDTSHLTAAQRVEAVRARHRRQHAIMQAAADAGFELGEDAPQNVAGRRMQESKWAAANVDARVHFSVRELLREQKPAVLNALEDFKRVITLVQALGDAPLDSEGTPAHELARLTPELLELIVNAAMPGQGPLVPAMLHPILRRPAAAKASLGTFRIFVRVRPLLPSEASGGEYSALVTPSKSQLVCHDARLARSGRRLSVLHHWYFMDSVFGATATDASVCDAVIEPLLDRVVSGEGDGTTLLYGQTGAGKTYTLSSLLERVASRLDSLAGSVRRTHVTVTFFEVASQGCSDLFNQREKLALRSDESDVVHACGAKTSVVTTGDELRETLAQGLALRSTVETQANPISSRSHAICLLAFRHDDDGDAAAEGAAPTRERTLRIVDLAGSERNYETLYEKSREFQRDTSAINKSLMALKDCFRESARLRELAALKERRAAGAAAGAASSVAARARGGRPGVAPDSAAAQGYVRMRASREEADGGLKQHFDLTPKAVQDAKCASALPLCSLRTLRSLRCLGEHVTSVWPRTSCPWPVRSPRSSVTILSTLLSTLLSSPSRPRALTGGSRRGAKGWSTASPSAKTQAPPSVTSPTACHRRHRPQSRSRTPPLALFCTPGR